jgi:hypothetical protein
LDTGVFIGTRQGDVYLVDNFGTLSRRLITTISQPPEVSTTVLMLIEFDTLAPALYLGWVDINENYILQVLDTTERPRKFMSPTAIHEFRFSPDRGPVLVRHEKDFDLYWNAFDQVVGHLSLP